MTSMSASLCRCLKAKTQRSNKVAPDFTAIGPMALEPAPRSPASSSSRPRQAPPAPQPFTQTPGNSAVRVSTPGAPVVGSLAQAEQLRQEILPLQARTPDSSSQTQPPKPSPLQDVAEGNYVVEFKRMRTSDRWGLIWDSQIMEKRNVRVVEKVSPNSIAAEWNNCNPGREIRVGDTLIQVNGRSGRLEYMTMELSRSLEMLCEFKPVETRARPSQKTDVPLPTLASSSTGSSLGLVGSGSPTGTHTTSNVAPPLVSLAPESPRTKIAPTPPPTPIAASGAQEVPVTPPPLAPIIALSRPVDLARVVDTLESSQALTRNGDQTAKLPEESSQSPSPRDLQQKRMEASAIVLPEDLMLEKPSALRKMALELGCTDEELEKSDDAATQQERKAILIQTITQVLSLCPNRNSPEPEPIPTTTSGSSPSSLPELMCPSCETEVVPGDRFCRKCGATHAQVDKAEMPIFAGSQLDTVTSKDPEKASTEPEEAPPQEPPLEQKEEIEVLFLPKEFRGCPIVRHEGGNIFRVDNSQLDTGGRGVAYRFSKNLDDKSLEFAEWGTCIVAVDEYDGWIKLERQALQQRPL